MSMGLLGESRRARAWDEGRGGMAGDLPFADDLGPAKTIHVHEKSLGLDGVLVVDNVARGPSIGGLRMAPDVTADECARLARAMTLKNAAAGLPHGGGKSVLRGDPRMAAHQKERLIRAFAHALRNEADYIFGLTWGPTRRAWRGSRTRSIARSGCHARSGAFRWTRSEPRDGESDTPAKSPHRTAVWSSAGLAS
jgi:hypothetical protein